MIDIYSGSFHTYNYESGLGARISNTELTKSGGVAPLAGIAHQRSGTRSARFVRQRNIFH